MAVSYFKFKKRRLFEGTLRRHLITPPAPRKFNKIGAQKLCYQLTEVKDLNKFKGHGCGTIKFAAFL